MKPQCNTSADCLREMNPTIEELKRVAKKKRYRMPVAKEGELLVKYGKEFGDESLFYCYPDNECGMKRDSRMLAIAFERTILFPEDGRTLRQELEARGYDITTLTFSIKKAIRNNTGE